MLKCSNDSFIFSCMMIILIRFASIMGVYVGTVKNRNYFKN